MRISKLEWIKVALIALVILINGGCKREEITSYEVKRIEPTEKTSGSNEPVRLLAAIFSKGDSTWFFKLVGPVAKLSNKTEDFEKFVRSVKIKADGSTPPIEWNAPSNWKAGITNELRYATFLIDPEENPKLELAVTKLGKDSGTILANINRWREQIGLGAVTEADLASVIKKEDIDGVNVVLADYIGVGGKKGPMMPPFAKSGPQMPIPIPKTTPPSNQSSPMIKEFKKPDSWEQVPNSVMSVATFKANDASGKADITLTPLAGPAGGLESNINRWRQQLGLAPQTPEQIKSSLTKIPTTSGEALCIDIEGASERITGAIISTAENTWFVKMKGANASVKAQKQSFEKFVSSLNFANGGK